MGEEMNLTEMRRMLNGKTIEETIIILVSLFPGRVVFTTSFGTEDQVITHIIFNNHLPVEVATLDTGRLFPETYKVFNETIKKYGKKIKVYFPDHEAVESMMTDKGPFSFFYSKENSQECCRLTKVITLNRALKGREV